MATQNINVQSATSVQLPGGIPDALVQVYGRIQGTIMNSFISQQFKNTNYSDTPTKGGTIHVRRFKTSLSQAYGTARTNHQGNNLVNDGVDIKINTDKEIAEELSQKDRLLYGVDGDASALLTSRQSDYAISMGSTLEDAYFLELQTAAYTFDTSPYTNIDDKISAMIEYLELTKNDNVNGVDRELMVLTLAPKHFDALEKYVYTQPNPLNGGLNAKYFHRVRVEPAVRQTVDAVLQVVGSVAQPVVMGNYKVEEAQFSGDLYSYLPYFFGTKAVMPDLIVKGAISADNNISA